MEQLIELGRVDAADRLLGCDQALADHRHRGLQRRGGGAFRRTRLQEIQLLVLDGELDVLHVTVVRLQPLHRVDELVERLGQRLAHRLDRLRGANAGDDVLALGIREELAVEARLARRRIARERDPRPRPVPLVPEHHLHDVHRRAEVVRNVVRPAIDLRPRVVPRPEDGAYGPEQLIARAGREVGAGLLEIDLLEGRDEPAQVVRGEIGVQLHRPFLLQPSEGALEAMAVDALHHLAEHLDQPPIRVEREPGVLRARPEPLGRLVVEAEIEDRVHHPRHRDGRARPDGDEQRVVVRAESLAGALLEPADVLVHLLRQPFRQLTAELHRGAAGIRRDREPRRHRHAHLGHLREADPLAPEQLPAAGRGLVEVVDVTVLHRGRGI